MSGSLGHAVTVDQIYKEALRRIKEQGGNELTAMENLLNDKHRFAEVLRAVGAEKPGSNCPDFPPYRCQ